MPEKMNKLKNISGLSTHFYFLPVLPNHKAMLLFALTACNKVVTETTETE